MGIVSIEVIFFDFGYPRVIKTDGGPCYCRLFGRWMADHSIYYKVSNTYNPNSNGLSESHERRCKKILKTAVFMK